MLAGFDTSDGVGGVIGAAVATKLGLPYLSSAAKIEPDPAAGTVRVRRISATGFDVLEAPMPALIVGTQLLGEPRYPSLKGIMAARSKEVVDEVQRPTSGSTAALRRRRRGANEGHRAGEAAGARRDAGGSRHARGGREGHRRPPRLAEAHLMAGTIWVVAETNADGSLAKSSSEVATLARTLAEAAGGDAAGIVVAADPKAAAEELAGLRRHGSSRSPSRPRMATPGPRSRPSGQRRFSPPRRPPPS